MAIGVMIFGIIKIMAIPGFRRELHGKGIGMAASGQRIGREMGGIRIGRIGIGMNLKNWEID